MNSISFGKTCYIDSVELEAVGQGGVPEIGKAYADENIHWLCIIHSPKIRKNSLKAFWLLFAGIIPIMICAAAETLSFT